MQMPGLLDALAAYLKFLFFLIGAAWITFVLACGLYFVWIMYAALVLGIKP